MLNCDAPYNPSSPSGFLPGNLPSHEELFTGNLAMDNNGEANSSSANTNGEASGSSVDTNMTPNDRLAHNSLSIKQSAICKDEIKFPRPETYERATEQGLTQYKEKLEKLKEYLNEYRSVRRDEDRVLHKHHANVFLRQINLVSPNSEDLLSKTIALRESNNRYLIFTATEIANHKIHFCNAIESEIQNHEAILRNKGIR